MIEVRDLIDGIAGDGRCHPDFAFGVENERIMDAIETAAEGRSWVRLT